MADCTSSSNHTSLLQDLEKWNNLSFRQKLAVNLYLQPMQDAVAIANLRDGILRRSIHGAMHASRVYWFIKIFDNIVKQHLPEFHKEVTQILTSHLGLPYSTILQLTQITGFMHDSARKGEAQDEWECESAQVAHTLLARDFMMDDRLAQIFSNLILYKDDAENYRIYHNSFPQKRDLKHSHSKYKANYAFIADFPLEYLRLLVQTSDCLDIIRITSNFKIQFLELYSLEARANFREAIDSLVIETTNLLARQCDLSYTTRTRRACYSSAVKTRFEQAPDPISAIAANMQACEYFREILGAISILDATLYAGYVTPNFCIHGTDSALLANIDEENHCLLNVNQMLIHGKPPFGGEITGGGLEWAKSTGYTAMAKIATAEPAKQAEILVGCNAYTLENVIAKYARRRAGVLLDLDPDLICRELDFSAHALQKNMFQSINQVLINFLRAKKLNVNLEHTVLGARHFAEWRQKCKDAVNFECLLYLMLRHVVPTENKDPRLSYELIREQYTYANLTARINKANLELIKIWNSNDPDILRAVIANILYIELVDGTKIYSHNIDLEKAATIEAMKKVPAQEDILECFTFDQLHDNIDNCNYILVYMLNYRKYFYLRSSYMPLFAETIISMDEKLSIFLELIRDPAKPEPCTAEQIAAIRKNIPMVLCSLKEEELELFDFQKQEYRVKANKFSLRDDCFMIATDSEEHIKELHNMLHARGIYDLHLVLFDDLQSYKKYLQDGIGDGNNTVKNIIIAMQQRHQQQLMLTQCAGALSQRGRLRDQFTDAQTMQARLCSSKRLVFGHALF